MEKHTHITSNGTTYELWMSDRFNHYVMAKRADTGRVYRIVADWDLGDDEEPEEEEAVMMSYAEEWCERHSRRDPRDEVRSGNVWHVF